MTAFDPNTNRIELGDEVQDTISGVKGIAIGKTTWITGCANIQIKPQGVDRDGKPCESFAADEPVVKVIKKGKIKLQEPQTPKERGGPAHGTPKRSY
jgi:hypothetical protein